MPHVRIGQAELLKGQLLDPQEGRIVGLVRLDVLHELDDHATKQKIAAELLRTHFKLGARGAVS